MKKIVKIICFVIIAAGIGAAAVWSSSQPMAVPAVTAEPREAYAYFTETGTFIGSADFTVFPEVSGTVLRVLKEKGDYAEAGEVIVEVDSADYARQAAVREANIAGHEARIETALQSERNSKDEFRAQIASLNTELSQIEAERKSAEAARLSEATVPERLKLLEVTIDKVKSSIRFSEDNIRKLEQLYEAGIVPATELEEARNNHEASLTELREYETEYAQVSGKAEAGDLAVISEAELFDSQRETVNGQISALNNNLAKDYSGAEVRYYQSLIETERLGLAELEKRIENCAVRTPVSGYIAGLPADGSSAVTPQSAVAVIKTEGDPRLESYVSIKDIAGVNVNDAVEIILKGRDEDSVYNGTVTEISPWAEAKESSLGLTEKKVRVLITAEADAALIPGSDADVRYTLYREQDKILVPTGAVFSSGGEDFVFVIEDGAAVTRKIETGARTLTDTVVESGVNAGDVVIAEANTAGLAEGSRVIGE